MKKFHVLLIFIGFSMFCIGQAPQAFKYQAIIRDASGTVIINQLISLKISILAGNIEGELVYSEIHDVTTNNLGLVNIEIGRGLEIEGDFNYINWGQESHFIKLEVDMEGGMNYELLGISQLLSVPYALYAETSGSGYSDSFWHETYDGIYYNDGNVGIGTYNPENSAALDVSSNEKGFLPPRMSEDEILNISNPATGLLVFNTSNNKFYAYVTGVWKEISYGTGTLIYVPFPCGDSSIIVNHIEGSVAPITKTVTYGTIGNIPGEPEKCWITSNLGADHQAEAMDDATEASAGWYWQFNRMQGYMHDGTSRFPNTTWIYIDENSDWESNNDPCRIELGIGWHVPTRSEWTNVDEGGNWTNWYGPWNSDLKLHAGGYIGYLTGNLQDRGIHGTYASTTQSSNIKTWMITFESSTSYLTSNFKSFALNLRCVRK